MISAEQLVRRVRNLSSLPDLYMRLDEAINVPNSSFDYISNIIAEDTSLTARLLRITNSSLYNFPSKIDTIQRAMSIIGTKELKELVLATSIIDIFKNVKTDFISMESFWCHSIACGVAARVIATSRREVNVERFYVAGLLHDIGKLIIYTELPDEMEKILEKCAKENKEYHQAERTTLGFNHADVGRLLLKQWRLPIGQQEAVGFHHNPEDGHRYPIEVSVIHLADIIVNAMELGTSGTLKVPQLNENAWQQLDISKEIMEKILIHTEVQYKEAIKLFIS